MERDMIRQIKRLREYIERRYEETESRPEDLNPSSDFFRMMVSEISGLKTGFWHDAMDDMEKMGCKRKEYIVEINVRNAMMDMGVRQMEMDKNRSDGIS